MSDGNFDNLHFKTLSTESLNYLRQQFGLPIPAPQPTPSPNPTPPNPPTTQLPAPANFQFSAVDDDLSLQYDAVSGASKYQIEFSRAN